MALATAPVRLDPMAVLRQLAPVALPQAARASLTEYVHRTFPGTYDVAPHHALIIEHLEAVECGEIKRLLITMPPRRGKSELASVRFPAWYLGRHPDESIIAASHTASLAYDFSRQVRRQIASPDWPFPGARVAEDEGAVQQWGISGRRGRYIAAGVGGAITGKGGNLLIDDPIKSREQAGSVAFRERAFDWYQHDAYTRLPKDGWVILIQTRWHDDDPAGRLLALMAEGGDQWTVLSLPEIAEEGEPDALGRAPGEALWPARYPAEATRTIRLTMPHVWWPLFQQRPSAVAGGMLRREWFARRFDVSVLPEYEMVVIVVDSAFKEDVANDPSGWSLWGATETEIDCIDGFEGRLAYPDLIRGLRDFYAKWEHLNPWLYIEDAASGQSAIQTLQRESMIPVRGFTPKGSKVSRAQDASRFAAAGRIRIAEGAPWAGAMVDQLARFPAAAHDEWVDQFSMAVKILTRAVAVPGDPDEQDDASASASNDIEAVANGILV